MDFSCIEASQRVRNELNVGSCALFEMFNQGCEFTPQEGSTFSVSTELGLYKLPEISAILTGTHASWEKLA